MSAITRHELDDLQRLIRQREKVLKSAAKQRSAEVLADFENQMGQQFSFDQDEVWAEAVKIAEDAVVSANERIRARCRKLGMPDRFAPKLAMPWICRGENASAERRAELRKMAVTAVEAQEQKAKTQIELSCLDAQTKLAVSGLTSEAALGFVEALPSVEDLMPRLSFAEVAGNSNPPVAERLLSSNALRQARFRERQKIRAGELGTKALQGRDSNVTEPLQVADVTGSNGGKREP